MTYGRKDYEVNDDEVESNLVTAIPISVDAMKKIYSYAEAVDSEIAGLLVVDTVNGKQVISDALIFEQRASSAEVELDIKSVSKEIAKLAKEKKVDIEKIKGWWHSHNDMEVFWSSTDDACFDNMSTISSIVYGIVVNKRGDCKSRVDINTELGSIKIKNLKLTPAVTSFDATMMEEARSKILPPEDGIVTKCVKRVKKWISNDKKESSTRRK